jgi:hypothetical protein
MDIVNGGAPIMTSLSVVLVQGKQEWRDLCSEADSKNATSGRC